MNSVLLREAPYNAWATHHIPSTRVRANVAHDDGGCLYCAVFEHALQFIGLLSPESNRMEPGLTTSERDNHDS